MPFPQFDRSRLRLLPLSERQSDVNQSAMIYPNSPRRPFDHPSAANLPPLAAKIVEARRAGRAVIFACGAHVVKCGLGPLLIDLMRRGMIDHLALNGAGMIHDFELALTGATSENVARYIAEGQFGLWLETGIINTATRSQRILMNGQAYAIGLGEAVGGFINFRNFSNRKTSVLAAGQEFEVPVTVHVGIGLDIIHEHPNCDGAAIGAASYADFLVFAQSVTRLEGGVFVNIGSAVHGPEVFLKALSMARNVAHQDGQRIERFTTAVFDLADLGDVGGGAISHAEPAKSDPRYYFRPLKSILCRTVADGGESFYIQGDHAETVPALYDAILAAAHG